ncbi:PIG-L family deacetylase [Maritalea sp.]|jgi:LmbE family N-acetylglucosaminyl deacetylase|uniref:PIG-L family deacetylase n=1 Tax=Maritalea sp. TaxID=2003361 RepID=UPI0039E61017
MSISDGERLQQAYAHPKATQLWKALQSLKSVASFMNTGAHPDDETSRMIAAIGFRDGVKLSHACSTRGEGGQNAIGTETKVKLGIVRTREMERAAEVLNMTQYWLCQTPSDPLGDFGFSKSGEETLSIWGEKRTLERFVHILRQERPDMIAVTFLDVPGQHGHHRAMTQSAFKAVKLAADPTYNPEAGLDVWQVKKLYLPAWSGAGDAYDDDLPPPPKTVTIDGSGSDPVLGMDYSQIGEVSRSFHMTQGMGNWHEAGAQIKWPLNLAWAAEGYAVDEASILDNLPRTLADLADFAGAPELANMLSSAQSHIDAALTQWPNYQEIRASCAFALKDVRTALAACSQPAKAEIEHRLLAKVEQLSQALFLAGDKNLRLELSTYEVRPGEKIICTVHAPAGDIPDFELIAPKGWTITKTSNQTFNVDVPNNEEPSDPLPDEWYPNRSNSQLFVRMHLEESGQKFSVDIEAEERLNIVSSHEVMLDKTALILNLQTDQTIQARVERKSPPSASLSISADIPFDVECTHDQISISKNSNSGAGLFKAVVQLDDKQTSFQHRMFYPHTGAMTYAQTAEVRVLALDLQLPTGKIGYVSGGSDRSAYWLNQAGFNISEISDETLQRGDFSEFDTILVGVFALRTRPAFAKQISTIHKWVHAGGNLVTLYHRPWDNWDSKNTALAPITIGKPSLRWRVTDQNAEVQTLLPEHPLLNGPNKITAEDWKGWDKERGLYFASTWDSQYETLVSMADAGETPLKGSLLSGRFGKGRHTHTSLILHHQLDQLVPGAYRLMANLLNRPHSPSGQ